jgi:hypothetical protein
MEVHLAIRRGVCAQQAAVVVIRRSTRQVVADVVASVCWRSTGLTPHGFTHQNALKISSRAALLLWND